jgi:hypothetical protein
MADSEHPYPRSRSSIEERLLTVELKLKAVVDDLKEEKCETREYRITLQNKVDALIRISFVGMGILMALNFVAPLIIKILS